MLSVTAPVTDNMDTVGEILFFFVGFGKKTGVVVVHNNENESTVHAYPRGENKGSIINVGVRR